MFSMCSSGFIVPSNEFMSVGFSIARGIQASLMRLVKGPYAARSSSEYDEDLERLLHFGGSFIQEIVGRIFCWALFCLEISRLQCVWMRSSGGSFALSALLIRGAEKCLFGGDGCLIGRSFSISIGQQLCSSIISVWQFCTRWSSLLSMASVGDELFASSLGRDGPRRGLFCISIAAWGICWEFSSLGLSVGDSENFVHRGGLHFWNVNWRRWLSWYLEFACKFLFLCQRKGRTWLETP